MPYRRLPNTDQARLRALKTAVQRASESDFSEQVIPYRLTMEAETCLLKLENVVSQNYTNIDNMITDSRRYRKLVQNARMYISHFIQVLNLAVQRGEIKREMKRLYHLDESRTALPDLSTEDDLLRWGKNIIEGETMRMSQGGIAINCPAINKVKVHYEMFSESQRNQTLHRLSANRVSEDLDTLRAEADAIILQIWDAVTAYYANRLPYERMKSCENYGLKFYYRKGEKPRSPERDEAIARAAASQMKLDI